MFPYSALFGSTVDTYFFKVVFMPVVFLVWTVLKPVVFHRCSSWLVVLMPVMA